MQEAGQTVTRIEGRRGIGGAMTGVSSAALAAVLAAWPLVGAAQNDARWEHPATPWGDPDLQGRWPIRHMTLTPLERPVELGTRAYLTDEEFAERAAAIEARNTRYDREIASSRLGQGHWAEAGQIPQRQASLIVDPPNGRLPALTEVRHDAQQLAGHSVRHA